MDSKIPVYYATQNSWTLNVKGVAPHQPFFFAEN